MDVAAFYHVWLGGEWRTPFDEFDRALDDSRFPGPTCYGVTGTASSPVDEWWTADVVAMSASGNESVTLNALRVYAQTHDGAILYAHTKGSATVEPFRDRWRRSMTARVVANWRENLAILEAGDVDAVGCHWLTEAQYPGMFGPMTIPAEGSGFFGGNFWMARCDYLRTLPPCEVEPRWKAESWIGINKPRVVDLLPGWPHDRRWSELCG